MVSVARQTLLDNGSYIGCAAEATADPNWNSCVFALDPQSESASNPSTELTGKSLTWYNGAYIYTGGPFLFTTSGGGYVTTPDSAAFDLAANDFTFRCRVRWTSTTGGWLVCQGNDAGNSDSAWGLFQNGSNVWSFYYNTSGTSWVGVTLCTFTPSYGPFYDFELSRQGSSIYFFINGVLQAVASCSGTIYNSSRALAFAAASDGGSPTYCGLQAIQLYKGVCLHTSSFATNTYDILRAARRYPGGVYGL